MKITAGALNRLARIALSCMPALPAKSIQSASGDSDLEDEAEKAYIVRCAQEGDKDFALFRQGLLFPEDPYDLIGEYAESSGRTVIDDAVICEFFGGRPHLDKISRLTKDYELIKPHGSVLRSLVFFAHMLNPMEIVVNDGVISGIYRNAGKEIVVTHLVPFPSDSQNVLSGKKALVHFAAIVALEPDDRLAKCLLMIQAEDQGFVSALDIVSRTQKKGIDYQEFFNLSECARIASESVRL